MKEITFFVDRGCEYQIASVIDILSLKKGIKTVLLNRKQWQGYDFGSCAIAITTDSIGEDIATVMKRAKESGVPSLTIQDGIIEYEHCWKKRLDRFRPLLTDRIAVLGDFSKQILVSWDVASDKIDVVGCPRFDVYSELKGRLPSKPRILLTSANTPFVDEQTKEEFRSSFIDIAKDLAYCGVDFFIRLNKRKTVNLFLKELTIIKRLRQNKASITNDIFKRLHLNQRTISSDISEVTAVITSISTIALEAMAMGRPVAVLNYSGETTYHKTPWEIGSPHHVKRVVHELLNPPPEKMLFQNQLFNEYVRCDGLATNRVVEIINKMMLQ